MLHFDLPPFFLHRRADCSSFCKNPSDGERSQEVYFSFPAANNNNSEEEEEEEGKVKGLRTN